MAQTLNHSPADIARRVLIREGVGVDPPSTPWPIYASAEPDTPDSVITLYDTEGVSHGRAMPTGELFTHYGIQVKVRAARHEDGWLKADEIRNTMAEVVSLETVTIGSSTYTIQSFNRIGPVLSLGADVPPSRRVAFTINARIVVRKN